MRNLMSWLESKRPRTAEHALDRIKLECYKCGTANRFPRETHHG